MALDKLTLLDETIINTTATTVATNVVNNSAQTNYISFPVATSNPLTNGWRVYSDEASNSPVDGTGGSANSTLTQNTSSPLNSTGDFRLTKNSGASRQGEGISTDFTIASRHLGKVLQISFDYEIIGATTLATDDLRIYIIQDPTGTPVVIEPVNVGIQGTVTGVRLRHLATFQTHISITSYRLCIHIKTTTNSAQTIDFNNFRVWETTQSIGSIITDWQSYTPSVIKSGINNQSFFSRRDGGNIQISFGWQVTSGTTPIALLTEIIPSGLNIDLTKIAPATSSLDGNSRYNVGHFYINDYGTANVSGAIIWNTAENPDQFFFSSSVTMGVNDTISGFISIPIQGWGSSVAMSSDTGDGRVVACSYQGNPSFTTGNFFGFPTRRFDTHNAYNTSTGEFTVPISGLYRVSTTMGSSAAADIVYASLDGSTYAYLFQTPSSVTYVSSGSVVVEARAGQRISLVKSTSSSLYSGNTQMGIYIERISAGSQVIANNETTAMNAVKSTGSIPNGGAVTSWSSLPLDTHSAFNLTTGEYTIPSSGVYAIYGIISENSPITGAGSIQIQSNATGSFVSQAAGGVYHTGGSIYVTPNAYVVKRCVAGERIRLFSTYQPSTPNGPWQIMNFSISRVGI